MGSAHKEPRGSFNPWLREDSQRFLRLTGAEGQQLPGQSLAVSRVQHRGVPRLAFPRGREEPKGPGAGTGSMPLPTPSPSSAGLLAPHSHKAAGRGWLVALRWILHQRGESVHWTSWREGFGGWGRHAPAGHVCPPPLVPRSPQLAEPTCSLQAEGAGWGEVLPPQGWWTEGFSWDPGESRAGEGSWAGWVERRGSKPG